jgi:RNA polymerase sigma-70 factor (TIGR02957 family)
MTATEDFVRHRNLLFTVAYELLGSASDAEDVLQESWLRWAKVEQADVQEPRAYLVRIVTRQALNRLRTQQRRRESYVGPWLPEPVLTSPDIADDVVLADHVSLAMLRVLDTLTPTERAVFVLREVFGFGYDEIATAIQKTEANCRQIASRARSHVRARRPKASTDVDREAVVERFKEACIGGDLQALMDALAPDVVLIADGGGKAGAALRPVLGKDHVARFLLGVAARALTWGDVRFESVHVNGEPGMSLIVGTEVVLTGVARFDGATISELYYVRNPDKLLWMDEVVPLTR